MRIVEPIAELLAIIAKQEQKLQKMEDLWESSVEPCRDHDKVVEELRQELEAARGEAAALRVKLREVREGNGAGGDSGEPDEPLFDITEELEEDVIFASLETVDLPKEIRLV